MELADMVFFEDKLGELKRVRMSGNTSELTRIFNELKERLDVLQEKKTTRAVANINMKLHQCLEQAVCYSRYDAVVCNSIA